MKELSSRKGITFYTFLIKRAGFTQALFPSIETHGFERQSEEGSIILVIGSCVGLVPDKRASKNRCIADDKPTSQD